MRRPLCCHSRRCTATAWPPNSDILHVCRPHQRSHFNAPLPPPHPNINTVMQPAVNTVRRHRLPAAVEANPHKPPPCYLQGFVCPRQPCGNLTTAVKPLGWLKAKEDPAAGSFSELRVQGNVSPGWPVTQGRREEELLPAKMPPSVGF